MKKLMYFKIDRKSGIIAVEEKKRILIIGPSPTKSKGGMATVIDGIQNDKKINSNYDISIHASYQDGNKIFRIVYSVWAYLFFLCKRKKYDLFHIHVASYGSTFRKRKYLKALKRKNKKVIVHIHGAAYLVFYEALSNRKKEKVKDFLREADMVLALSDEWKNSFENILHITNCHTLNNGIDTEMYCKAISDIEKTHQSFLFMGRLGKRKGSYDLLDAMEKAVKENPSIKLYMAGDGEVEKTKRIINDKKLNGNVEILGWIGFDKKIVLLKNVSTVVLPSYNEGLPMAILEGMAAGKAIISTNVGAIPEVVKEKNGILVKAGDIRALSEALLKCSTDIDMIKEMSKNNINIIDKEFSMKKMHMKLDEYYQLVFKEK